MELATRSLTKLKDREAPWDFWVPKASLQRDVLGKRKSSGGKSMTNLMRRGLRGSDPSKEARPAPVLFLLYCIGSAEGRKEQPCSFSRLARGGLSPVEGIIHPPTSFLKNLFLNLQVVQTWTSHLIFLSLSSCTYTMKRVVFAS